MEIKQVIHIRRHKKRLQGLIWNVGKSKEEERKRGGGPKGEEIKEQE
jgi:hypothetical protein